MSFKARTAVTLADGTGISLAGNSDTITITNVDRDTGLPAIIVDDAAGNMSFGNSNVTADTVRAKIGAGTGDGVVESITTTGTSGAATLSAAGVLNIPNYAVGDTGITGVTLAVNSTGTWTVPLSESITGRELTLTSNVYGGGAKVGYVPDSGTATTFLRGDNTWDVPAYIPNTDETYDLNAGAKASTSAVSYTHLTLPTICSV